ncbi:MAG TPA: dTDP-4-dehydrorhamnose reductase [Anaerohalosphaeraceae bacterium]|nr:dTDP-4-dehydrorhamnose reductase [Anaerohalosphaeraceae bacterium]
MNGTGPIVILGARGMLGTDLTACCLKHGLEVRAYDLPELDIRNEEDLKEAMNGCRAVVNCAAYTNVERAEQEPELAMQINAEAVGLLGRAAAWYGVPVMHISTDFVFDGTLERPYVETDPPNPLSAYGRSKWEGEKRLVSSGCRFCIVRVQWTYGRAGTNFVVKLLEAAKSRPVLRVVEDQVGSPTATSELAEVLVQMLGLPVFPEGVFHAAASGYTSRYEMARFICQVKGLPNSIEPCRTSEFPSAAKRPLNSRFDCRKLRSVLGKDMRPWQEPLREFLEQL